MIIKSFLFIFVHHKIKTFKKKKIIDEKIKKKVGQIFFFLLTLRFAPSSTGDMLRAYSTALMRSQSILAGQRYLSS